MKPRKMRDFMVQTADGTLHVVRERTQAGAVKRIRHAQRYRIVSVRERLPVKAGTWLPPVPVE